MDKPMNVEKPAGAASGLSAGLAVCPWCNEPILPGQPTGIADGDRMHIGCAAEEEDNAMFDRDMGW